MSKTADAPGSDSHFKIHVFDHGHPEGAASFNFSSSSISLRFNWMTLRTSTALPFWQSPIPLNVEAMSCVLHAGSPLVSQSSAMSSISYPTRWRGLVDRLFPARGTYTNSSSSLKYPPRQPLHTRSSSRRLSR